jgi:hypothetical protein
VKPQPSPPWGSTEIGGSSSSWWAVKPDVDRVAHGVPAQVDRLRGLGKVIVPQTVELIGSLILRSKATKGEPEVNGTTTAFIIALTLAVPGWARDKSAFCTTNTGTLDKNDANIFAADVESLTWPRVVPEGTSGAGTLRTLVEYGQPHSSVSADGVTAQGETGQWVKVTLIFGDAAGHVLWRKTRSGFEGVVSRSVGTQGEAYDSSADLQGFVTGFLSDLGRKGRACPSHVED